MTLRIITQRRWHYVGLWLSVRINKARRRSFLQGWNDFYDLFDPLRTFLFYVHHPVLWFKVRRYVRLRRAGIEEITL